MAIIAEDDKIVRYCPAQLLTVLFPQKYKQTGSLSLSEI